MAEWRIPVGGLRCARTNISHRKRTSDCNDIDTSQCIADTRRGWRATMIEKGKEAFSLPSYVRAYGFYALMRTCAISSLPIYRALRERS